jgi:hypothetical protein
MILNEKNSETRSQTQGESADGDSHRDEAFNARAYQLEMLEESLKRNTIVAVSYVIEAP